VLVSPFRQTSVCVMLDLQETLVVRFTIDVRVTAVI
jgi:hypothetical protein